MVEKSIDLVGTSKAVCTFPNGDFFFVELRRKDGAYTCDVKMASVEKGRPLILARGRGKTIERAELAAYERAIRRFPRFPRPPYLYRGKPRGNPEMEETDAFIAFLEIMSRYY